MRTRTFTGLMGLMLWLIAPAFVSAQNWHATTSPNASTDFNGVFFASDQTGYTVGAGGSIYKTIDGGLSWVGQTSNTTEILNDIAFTSATAGIAVGANGTIRRTTNGGTTWTTVTATGTATTLLYKVQFLDASNGFIVGSAGKMIKTTDSGATWSTVTTGTVKDLRTLSFVNTSIGFIAGNTGLIRKTINSGTSWVTQTIGTSANLNDIFFVDSSVGYVVGDGGDIWKTIDGGTTWTSKGDGFSLSLQSVQFTDALTGYIASTSAYTRITIDGGDHWIDYGMPGTSTLNAIHFPSPTTGYMVGTGGAMLKYQSNLEPEVQPADLQFSEVYGNTMQLNFTPSPDIPTGYIAIRKTGSAPTTDPLDGIPYTVGQILGDGIVAAIGSGTFFGQTALTASTSYFYKIYAFNGSGAAINYNVTAPLTGNRTTYPSGTPWTLTYSAGSSYPSDPHFFDANNGGVAGTYNLLSTSSGGQTWSNAFSGNGDVYEGAYFTSATTGYVVGYNGSLRVVRRTVNAGATWVDQVRATSTYALSDVWFATTTTGLAVGGAGNILRTTNGLNWFAVSSGTVNDLNSVTFPTSTVGYAVGAGGTIIKTTNGGSSWMPTPASGIITTNILNDVFFTDANTGYAVGASGIILKTIDGATSWTPQSSGTVLSLQAVHFANSNIGYAVGSGGTLLKTINGGASWFSFAVGVSVTADFRGIYFPTLYTGYAAGVDGSSGIVYKYQSVPEPVSQPTGLSYTSISASGLTGNFTGAAGADGYLVVRKVGSSPTSDPLDGITYNVGDILGDGIIAYAGTTVSFTETSLLPGTNYFYEIYSYNTSTDAGSIDYRQMSPLGGSTTTTLLPPAPNAATVVTASGFNASWATVSGATSYRLDVSSDGFLSFAAGYNNAVVGSTSTTVTGLSPGINYSYRVRSVNVSGSSTNSGTIGVITLPAAPAASAATLVTTSGFTANWSTATGATGYFIDVSTNSFSSFVSGYNNLSVSGTSAVITGLTSGVAHQYRLRAIDASGTSINSSTISTITLCQPPTASAATSVTVASFVANWSAATGAADYRIDVSTDPSFTFVVGSYNNLTVAGTSVLVSGLNAGSNYYYRIRASNASGSSASSSVINVLTLPAAPVANDATSVASLTFATSWNSVSSATGYFIDVSTASDFSSFVAGYNNTAVASTSTTVTVPAEGLTYYYRVRAVNATGSSANSNLIATLLRPATPVALAATLITGTTFTANWAAASGATGYLLDVSSDNFISNVPGYDNLPVAGTSTSVISLLEGVTYKYRVRGVNSSWTSGTSNIISALTISPAPVANTAASITTTTLTARWFATAGAASYRLDVSTDNFSTFVSGFNNVNVSGTSSSVTGLTAGTTYQYRLRAVSASGTSPNSNTISSVTLSTAPVANASTAITPTGFTTSWNAVAGATNYTIDVSVSNTFTTYEGIYHDLSTGGTSLAITGLTSGLTYYYRVRSNNASGASAYSNVITTLIKPAAPIATAATAATTTGFVANWGVVSGTTGYKLDVSINDFISNLTGFNDLSVSGTSQAVTGLTAGNTYKFRVRSLNAAGASDNSNVIAAITIPPAPVATVASLVSASGFTANWTITSGVTAYFLDVSTDVAFGSFIAGYNNFASSTGSQTITGLTDGTTYYYRVRSANVAGTSSNSNSITAVTLPLVPTTSAASAITANGFTANWSSVTGATEYRIDVSTDNAFSFYVGSYSNQQVLGTTLPVTGLSPGTLYYYRVRSANASGSSSSSATINVLTLPGAPTANDALSITSTTFLANWGNISTATSYRIDVSINSGFSSFISGYNNLTVSTTSATVTVPTEGTTYFYRVKAVSSAGSSAYSNSITTLVKPAAPTATAASAVAADSFSANWSAVAGATGYYLDVSSNNFASMASPYDNFLLAGTSINITGLSSGATYQYRVRSYNATGSSTNSATISVVTIPPAPVTVNATSFTTTSFTANWPSASGAASYRLDVSSDFNFGIGTFVAGFNNLTVSGTSNSVTGLTAGTVYYYRVRAVNASGTSPNSNVTSSTNIPSPPTGVSASSITTTAFTAGWSPSGGALSYSLDVSSNNFASFISGYNGLSVSGTSQNVTGLTAGTSYQFRVRAVNASGTSLNSSAITMETLPNEPSAQPTTLVFTNVTTTSMSVSFTAASGGAAAYLVLRKSDSAPTAIPVDGIAYSAASSLGDATVVYVGSGLSFAESTLTPGTTWYYSIFSYNGSGVTSNYRTISPLTASQITVPSAPAMIPASSIGQNSFVANWTATTGAAGYLIDVSTDNFATFVNGFNNQGTGGVTAYAVSGLAGGSTYQYRIRAQNAAGISISASPQSVLTIPDTPVGLKTSAITATSFIVSWTPVTGIDNYFIDLSTDVNFSILTVNNTSTTTPTVTFSGLGSATAYYVRVRTGNASGVSVSSVGLKQITAASSGAAVLSIAAPTFPATIKTAAVAISANVTGGTDPKKVIFHYRKITDSNFKESEVTPKTGTIYEVTIQPDGTDELGMEFYFTATDDIGQVAASDTKYYIYKAIDAASNQSIPFAATTFDGKVGTYQMFSIPYALTDNTIANLFEPALNGFSNTRWRLLHYTAAGLTEYPGQLKKIELGQGYWFNTTQSDFQIKLSAGVAQQVTPLSPFTITLDKGWNQIGDPYPFNISWNDVVTANAAAGLNPMWLFENGSFTKHDVLPVWKGAFVFSENGGTVKFPLSSKTSSGGRVAASASVDPSAGEWHLPMTVNAGGLRSEFSVGMRVNAKNSKDKYDEIAVPRFLKYLEATSFHPEYFAPNFSGDVVPVSETHTWEFVLKTNTGASDGSIAWNKEQLGTLPFTLLLLDVHNQTLTNMKAIDHYSFVPQDGQQLKVIMTHEGIDIPGTIGLGNGYPNPFVSSFSVPVYTEVKDAVVGLEVFNAMGQLVKKSESVFQEPGYHELKWDGHSMEDIAPSGMLLYRTTVNGAPSVLKRAIKAN